MCIPTVSEKPAKKRRPRPNPDAIFLTVPEVAAEARLAREKILKWISTGELPASNIATNPLAKRPRWLVRRADWDEFLQRRRAVPATPAPVRRVKSDCPRYV